MTPVVRALRGATTLNEDSAAHMNDRVVELLEKIWEANQLSQEQVISCLFTTSPDVRSAFPAVGARIFGLVDTPLMCAQEIDVEGAATLCIRVMIHAYMSQSKAEVKHVYLHEATQLRGDLNT